MVALLENRGCIERQFHSLRANPLDADYRDDLPWQDDPHRVGQLEVFKMGHIYVSYVLSRLTAASAPPARLRNQRRRHSSRLDYGCQRKCRRSEGIVTQFTVHPTKPRVFRLLRPNSAMAEALRGARYRTPLRCIKSPVFDTADFLSGAGRRIGRIGLPLSAPL